MTFLTESDSGWPGEPSSTPACVPPCESGVPLIRVAVANQELGSPTCAELLRLQLGVISLPCVSLGNPCSQSESPHGVPRDVSTVKRVRGNV